MFREGLGQRGRSVPGWPCRSPKNLDASDLKARTSAIFGAGVHDPKLRRPNRKPKSPLNLWYRNELNRLRFFAYSWKLPAYSGVFFCSQLTILGFLLTVGVFSAYNFSFFAHSWSFFAYSGKVRLIKALRDCEQRSLAVNKQAPTVSKKNVPHLNCRELISLAGWMWNCKRFGHLGSKT